MVDTSGWASIEIWPKPKIGDQFSIVMDVRENWALEFLRKLGIRRKPRLTEIQVHTVTRIAYSK